MCAVRCRLAGLLHLLGRHGDAVAHFTRYTVLRPRSTWGYVLASIAYSLSSKVRQLMWVCVHDSCLHAQCGMFAIV